MLDFDESSHAARLIEVGTVLSSPAISRPTQSKKRALISFNNYATEDPKQLKRNQQGFDLQEPHLITRRKRVTTYETSGTLSFEQLGNFWLLLLEFSFWSDLLAPVSKMSTPFRWARSSGFNAPSYRISWSPGSALLLYLRRCNTFKWSAPVLKLSSPFRLVGSSFPNPPLFVKPSSLFGVVRFCFAVSSLFRSGCCCFSSFLVLFHWMAPCSQFSSLSDPLVPFERYTWTRTCQKQ